MIHCIVVVVDDDDDDDDSDDDDDMMMMMMMTMSLENIQINPIYSKPKLLTQS